MKRLVLILLTVMLLAPGCGLLGKKSEKTAAELASDGRTAFQDEDYRDALNAYQKIRDWYPFSPHATEAEIRIADSHFELEEYAEAAISYAEFIRLHPSHKETPRAAYQLGMTSFLRISTVDRDQTPAKEALYLFQKMVRNHPDSPQVEAARIRISECLESLAGAELSIASFFVKTERYKAARARLDYLLSRYADTRTAAEARTLLDALMAEHPELAETAEPSAAETASSTVVPSAN